MPKPSAHDTRLQKQLTPEDFEAVLRFLPDFAVTGREFVEHINQNSCYTHFNYTDDVWAFMKAVYDRWLLDGFEWQGFEAAAQIFLDQPERLATADLATVQKLLNLHVRKERYHDGHLAEVLASGHITLLLERLSALRPAA